MSADLAPSRYPVPDAVAASQRARELARHPVRTCAGEGGTCRLTPRHACARYGGSWCDQHWQALGIVTPTPDPARTLDGLRAAVVSGQRASGAAREASR